MTKYRRFFPFILLVAMVSIPAHASLLEWLFGGRATNTNYRSFLECATAVYKRDFKGTGELNRPYLAKECAKFVRTEEDVCERDRLLDEKHGHHYQCAQPVPPLFGPHPFEHCYNIMCE